MTTLGSLKGERFFLLVASLTSILVLLLLLPLLSIFLFFSPETAEKVFMSSEYAREVWSSLATTFRASAISTGLLILLGVPAAYLLSKKEFKGKSLVESLLDIPLVVPHTVAGIMVLTAFGRRGLLGALTSRLGLAVNDTFLGVVAAMSFVSAPIMIDVVKASFASVDPTLEAVSRTLGAGPGTTFLKVTLPLSWRGIVAGTILSWARALSEVGAILVVAYFPKTVNILILEFLDWFGLKYAIALAVPFLAIVLVLFVALRLILLRERA